MKVYLLTAADTCYIHEMDVEAILRTGQIFSSLEQAQTEAQEWNDAKNSWRALIRRVPDSHFVPEAKLQLAQLVLMH